MESRRSHQHELVVLLITIVGLSRLLDGPLLWPVGGLLLGAAALGSRQLLAEGGPRLLQPEGLITPSLAGVASLGAIRLVPLGLGLVPALIGAGLLVDRCLTVEAELRTRPHGPSSSDRLWLLSLSLAIAFLAFAGVAAIVPGGLVVTIPAGSTQPPALSETGLLLLALADAFVGGLLGFRFAMLRGAIVRDGVASAASYAVAIAVGAAGLRAMAIPRLLGPALLTLILFLWDSVRGSPSQARRDARWIWQLALLTILGVTVVAWNLQLRG